MWPKMWPNVAYYSRTCICKSLILQCESGGIGRHARFRILGVICAHVDTKRKPLVSLQSIDIKQE